jgi:hypothetical protein
VLPGGSSWVAQDMRGFELDVGAFARAAQPGVVWARLARLEATRVVPAFAGCGCGHRRTPRCRTRCTRDHFCVRVPLRHYGARTTEAVTCCFAQQDLRQGSRNSPAFTPFIPATLGPL